MDNKREKKITIRLTENEYGAFKEGAKCLDLSLNKLFVKSIYSYLRKKLSSSNKENVYQKWWIDLDKNID